MVRINVLTSSGTVGRPVLWRHFHDQNRRNPHRCHAMTVSGLMITSTVRHRSQARDSQPQCSRSTRVRRSRRGCDRSSARSWCRSAKTSSCKAARERAQSRSVFRSESKTAIAQKATHRRLHPQRFQQEASFSCGQTMRREPNRKVSACVAMASAAAMRQSCCNLCCAVSRYLSDSTRSTSAATAAFSHPIE